MIPKHSLVYGAALKHGGDAGESCLACTASNTSFQLDSKGAGLGPFTIANPSFTGCSDNLGGTDTITSNSTNGPWTATYVSSTGGTHPDLIRTLHYTAAGVCPTGTGAGTAKFSTVLKSGATGGPGFRVSPAIFGVS